MKALIAGLALLALVVSACVKIDSTDLAPVREPIPVDSVRIQSRSASNSLGKFLAALTSIER